MEPFEETLSELKRDELPPEWKEELLERACADDPGEQDVLLFGPVSKFALGAIAVCWVVIGALVLSTPTALDSRELADCFGIAPEEVPLLVGRIGTVTNSDLPF